MITCGSHLKVCDKACASRGATLKLSSGSGSFHFWRTCQTQWHCLKDTRCLNHVFFMPVASRLILMMATLWRALGLPRPSNKYATQSNSSCQHKSNSYCLSSCQGVISDVVSLSIPHFPVDTMAEHTKMTVLFLEELKCETNEGCVWSMRLNLKSWIRASQRMMTSYSCRHNV